MAHRHAAPVPRHPHKNANRNILNEIESIQKV